jgi:hypothetical protein
MLKETETQIQTAICEYLTLKGYFFWRQNNVAPVQIGKDGSIAMRRMPKYARKGTPDIYILVPGRVILMEVKSSTGVLSEEQKELQNVCGNFQIQYCVVRSIEDVQKLGL